MSSIFLVHHFPIILNEIRLLITKQYPSTRINSYDSFSNISHEIKINDIIIIYIDVPDLNLLKILKELQNTGVKIIVWIGSEDESTIRFLLQQKFQGYLLNRIENSELWCVLDNIQSNMPYLQPSLTSILFKQYLSESVHPLESPPSILTKREWEVLQLLTNGYSNEKVAHELYLTESTVKNHVSSILHKLEVPDRTGAVLKAIKNKWVIL